jgi:hypothetical protein
MARGRRLPDAGATDLIVTTGHPYDPKPVEQLLELARA